MAPLTKEQTDFYDENGYIVLDLLNLQEFEELSSEYDAIFKRKAECNLEGTWGGSWDKNKEQNVSEHFI